MIRSMTAFASARGALGPHSWTWELRGVNGKGLDLRLRVPDWLEGLEAHLRAELGKALGRGNVSLGLRLSRADDGGGLALNPGALATVLEALARTEEAADARGLTLAPSTAADVLALRGVLEIGATEDDPAPLVAQMKTELPALVAGFIDMRAAEGAALAQVITGQLDQIAQLTEAAAVHVESRRASMAEALRATWRGWSRPPMRSTLTGWRRNWRSWR